MTPTKKFKPRWPDIIASVACATAGVLALIWAAHIG